MRCNLSRVSFVIIMLFLSGALSGAAQTTSAAATAAESSKISSRIDSFKELSPDVQAKLSADFQSESKEHFGFETIKSVDDAFAIDVSRLPSAQMKALAATTMHVVDANLIPVAVLKDTVKPSGNQIYPDLQALVKSLANDDTLAVTQKVGRIRYWLRRGMESKSMQEIDAYLAGTGFVIGPGMIATACHVLDAITDQSGVNLSSALWVKIDFSADPQTHQAYLVTGVLGRGSMQGQDYAVLAVSRMSDDGSAALPDRMVFSNETNAKYVGVIGYPDISWATKACASGGDGCDETAKWFSDFAQKNPGVIKIISPGRKTGDFSPHGFPIFTYDAPTLQGQSGSPVIDLQSKQVIGLHYCCTGYKPNDNEPSCARLQPLSLLEKSDNEALAIKNVAVPAP